MTKILCVEDEVDIRQILIEELSDVGYEVLEAGNGREGLDVIVEENPDLVLCDITMPIMDGHSMLTELRDNHPDQADTPFIFLSALADREHVLQGKSLGADDYLTKPVDIDMLIATIDSRLRQIARMTKRKEEQFVKLYRSFNQPDTGNTDAPVTSTAAEHGKNLAPAVGVADDQLADQPAHTNGANEAPAAIHADGAHLDQPKAEPRDAAETQAEKSEIDNTASAPLEPAEETFEHKIQILLDNASGQPFVAHAQVIGLDEIKQSLGPQWANQSPRIQEIAKTTVLDYVAEGHGLELCANETLFVFFASTEGTTALANQDEIAAGFRKRLRREDSLDKRIKDRGALRLNLQKINLTAEEVRSCADFEELVLERLSEPSNSTDEEAKAALAKELEICRIVQLPVMSAKGAQTSLTITRFDGQTQNAIAEAENAGHIDDETKCLIDCAKLSKVAGLIDRTVQSNQPNLIVDVHYSTLASDAFLNRFQSSCTSLGRSILGQLVLNIREIASGVSREAVAPLIDLLRGNGCKVLIELGTISFESLDPKSLQLSIVTGDYAFFAENGLSGTDLRALIGQLHESKILLLMHNVPDADAARHMFGLGVDLAALN